MKTIEQLKRAIQDEQGVIARANECISRAEKRIRELDAELTAARWAAVDMQPGDAILVTEAIFNHMMEQEYSSDYVQIGRTFYAVNISNDSVGILFADLRPGYGAPIPTALVVDARRAWLARQETK